MKLACVVPNPPGGAPKGPARHRRGRLRSAASTSARAMPRSSMTTRAPASAPAAAAPSVPCCPRNRPLSRQTAPPTRSACRNCTISHPSALRTARALAPDSTASAERLCGAWPSTRTVSTPLSSQRPTTPGRKGAVSVPTVAGVCATARWVRLSTETPPCRAIGVQGSAAIATTGRPSASSPGKGGRSSRARNGAPGGVARSPRQISGASTTAISATGARVALGVSSQSSRSTRQSPERPSTAATSPGSSLSASSGPSLSVSRSAASPCSRRCAAAVASPTPTTAGKAASTAPPSPSPRTVAAPS
ncbi:hypothetical protein D3C73_562770 [compost metagenome]